MAKLVLVLLLLLLAVVACASASIDMDLGFLSTTGGSGAERRECRGTVAECLAEEEEGEYELG
ncbi:hypothetical protein BAE44_0014775 [Dichanthelium oligosanthes]|uniref:Phytosulfokine-beta n=1 Tax=Dichanthelium oligosanthes TaxID=888268 RepID=A0A1E5VGN1_9POAL|nr:hypothetical protein BAE44_0014775 [Dichanthelium oligosanthes]